MARQPTQRVSDLPTIQAPQAQVQTRVVATPHDTFSPGGTNESFQIAAALREFSPSLNRFMEQKDNDARKQARIAGEAQAAPILDPLAIINEAPALPESVNPAYKADFEVGYRSAIGHNLAGQSRDELMRQYQTNKDKPDFNLEGFLQQYTTAEFAGINNPEIRATLGKHHQEVVAAIRGDFRGIQFKRLDEDAKANLNGSLDSLVTADMDPSEVYAGYHQWLPQALASGKYTRGEGAQLLLGKLQQLSAKGNGRPELFDMFEQADGSGMSIINANPGLVASIEHAKRSAEAQREGYIQEQGLVSRSEALAGFHDDIKNGKAQEWTDDRLKMHIGKHGLFNSDREYQQARDLRDKSVDDVMGQASIIDTIRNGHAYSLSKENQKWGFDNLTAQPVATIVKTLDSKDPAAQAMLGGALQQIIGLHTLAGAPVANTQLKSLFESVKNSVPGKEGVAPQRFQSLAEAYRIIKTSNNSSLMDLYTDDDSRRVLDAYVAGREQGVDANSAYVQAYAGNTVEAKARAADIAKQPEFVAKVNKAVNGVVTSNTPGLLPNFLRAQWMGNYPDETGLDASARMEATRFLQGNHNANMDDVKNHLEKWISNTRVYVPTTNTIVEVPSGEGGPQAQEAISAYLGNVSKERGKDSKPDLIYKGNGKYQVMDHATGHTLATEVTLQQIKQEHYVSNHIVGAEAEALTSLTQKVRTGTLTADEVQANRALIAKAKTVGAWSDRDVEAVAKVRSEASAAKTTSLTFGANQRPDYSKLGVKQGMTNPSDLSKRFLDEGNLSGAVTAMGEGVVYRASPDPAKGAGMNIGMGYNLQANEKNLSEDFRKAGIPNDPVSIEAIKNGQLSINDDQVMRLYKAVQPRYEARAKTALEAKHPGEWDKLGAHQRAALTDLAYQVKDPSQFGPSMEALVSGVTPDDLFKVHYTDKNGVMKEDSRRNNLRLAMLRGPNEFGSVLRYTKGIPTNLIQASAK